MQEMDITAAQRRHIIKLINSITKAESNLETSKRILEQVQANASEFLVYTADALGLDLEEGWRFDQAKLAFVKEAADFIAPAAPQGAPGLASEAAASSLKEQSDNGTA